MLPFVLALSLLMQAPRQRLPPQPGGLREAPQEAIATLNGIFKSADKKFVTVEVENDQLMRMYITGSTKFIRNGKPAKASEFENGEAVIVDSSRDARMNLLAVRVELVKSPGPPR